MDRKGEEEGGFDLSSEFRVAEQGVWPGLGWAKNAMGVRKSPSLRHSDLLPSGQYNCVRLLWASLGIRGPYSVAKEKEHQRGSELELKSGSSGSVLILTQLIVPRPERAKNGSLWGPSRSIDR